MTTAALATLVALAGATYQGVATAIERRQFPHPGRLVDVGGHQLHVNCVGSGAPTVVLEAPAFGMSAAWSRVQPEIAKVTRTCSYDRAGLGWSESGDEPFEPGAVPDGLHTLLERAGERGPFVLVGQGLGTAFIRLFASRYPDDTAALVLIDVPFSGSQGDDLSRWFVRASPWLARAGVLRAASVFLPPSGAARGDVGGAMRAFMNRPDHLARGVREFAQLDEALRLSAAAEPKEGLPVWTVTIGDFLGTARLRDPREVERLSRIVGDVVRQARDQR